MSASVKLLPDYASAVALLLAGGGSQYGPSHLYVEFQNVADSNDPADEAAFDGDDPQSGLPYFEALGDTTDRDFLRVPLASRTVATTDDALYPNGNRADFEALCSAGMGIHGRTFGPSANSRVAGGALVAAVGGQADRSRDLVLARWTVAASEQPAALDTGEVSVRCRIST